MTPAGQAFIGVSLDSRLFSRAWVRAALDHILARHETVLWLLADDLLLYTRAVSDRHGRLLDFAAAGSALHLRADERVRFLRSEIARLPPPLRARASVARWGSFADARYVDLWRRLQVAYANVRAFALAVDAVAREHVSRHPDVLVQPAAAASGALFILDEMAMCLRVTEVGGWCHEYYPAGDLPVLTRLYAGAYAAAGLTVAALVGSAPRRRFTTLAVEAPVERVRSDQRAAVSPR